MARQANAGVFRVCIGKEKGQESGESGCGRNLQSSAVLPSVV